MCENLPRMTARSSEGDARDSSDGERDHGKDGQAC